MDEPLAHRTLRELDEREEGAGSVAERERRRRRGGELDDVGGRDPARGDRPAESREVELRQLSLRKLSGGEGPVGRADERVRARVLPDDLERRPTSGRRRRAQLDKIGTDADSSRLTRRKGLFRCT